MKEYIGTKIDIDSEKCKLKITQPVLVRSLIGGFVFNEPSVKPNVLATAGTHLVKSGIKLGGNYCSGVGKLLHLV